MSKLKASQQNSGCSFVVAAVFVAVAVVAAVAVSSATAIVTVPVRITFQCCNFSAVAVEAIIHSN